MNPYNNEIKFLLDREFELEHERDNNKGDLTEIDVLTLTDGVATICAVFQWKKNEPIDQSFMLMIDQSDENSVLVNIYIDSMNDIEMLIKILGIQKMKTI